ncbi:MAG: pimelyl-ACP methyl ester esterase BioV [Hydrogenimonas sp.]|nr:pimelyl-ACP methyl ester esterase BioV [Hydrogenimonas sp.]
MRFFSGFSLEGEEVLFGEFLKSYKKNPYIVAGFSYGAIKALEYVYRCEERVDRLLLLSPAYFVQKSEAFKKTQIIYFKKDPAKYLKSFFKNAAYPADSSLLDPFMKNGTLEELKELLEYEWPKDRLKSVAERGVKIEIYLGMKDRVVDAQEAHNFFKEYGQSYLFKPYGHILKEGKIGG